MLGYFLYVKFCFITLGDTIVADQLEGCRPDHLWRAGARGHLSCSEGEEHPDALLVRKDAPHYQEKRGTLRLQNPHLSTISD